MNKKGDLEIKKWDELIHKNFQDGMVNSASLATIEITGVLDKFSLWLMVGVGATATLVIANLDKIIPYLTPLGFKIAVMLLALSSLAGFAAKYFSLVVTSAANVTVRLSELLQSELKNYQEQCQKRDEAGAVIGYVSELDIDLKLFSEQYANLFPFGKLRGRIRNGMKNLTEEVNEAGNKSAVHSLVYQAIAVFLQSVFYILFLIVVTYFINIQ